MKTLIIFAAGALLAGSALAQGNISAPTVVRHALPPVSAPQSEGGLQRGVRLGNPAQMFNPFASARYGEGREFVTPRDENVEVRPRSQARTASVGLRLFSFSF
jgi:hypothetical protein